MLIINIAPVSLGSCLGFLLWVLLADVAVSLGRRRAFYSTTMTIIQYPRLWCSEAFLRFFPMGWGWNIAGMEVDIAFLSLQFGSWNFLWGEYRAKCSWSTAECFGCSSAGVAYLQPQFLGSSSKRAMTSRPPKLHCLRMQGGCFPPSSDANPRRWNLHNESLVRLGEGTQMYGDVTHTHDWLPTQKV